MKVNDAKISKNSQWNAGWIKKINIFQLNLKNLCLDQNLYRTLCHPLSKKFTVLMPKITGVYKDRKSCGVSAQTISSAKLVSWLILFWLGGIHKWRNPNFQSFPLVFLVIYKFLSHRISIFANPSLETTADEFQLWFNGFPKDALLPLCFLWS